MAAVRLRVRLPVVFTVAAEEDNGNRSAAPAASWMTAIVAAIDPDGSAERTVISARKYQLPPVEFLLWVQTVVEPSLRVKTMLGVLATGSSLEPNASTVRGCERPARRRESSSCHPAT